MYKNISKKAGLIILALFLAVNLCLLPGCGERESYDKSKVNPGWCSEVTGRRNPQDFPEEYEGYMYKTSSMGIGCFAPMEFEQFIERASVIIRGRVLGFDYVTVGSEENEYLYTDYYVDVYETLRGKAYSDLVTVREDGGENDREIFENGNICLDVGKEYVFFLWMPRTVGGLRRTDSDYYSTATMSEGSVYVCSGSRTDENGKTVPFEIDCVGPNYEHPNGFTYAEFKEIIKDLNERYPIDEKYMFNFMYKSLNEQLEKGGITQEQYDIRLAEEMEYGEILYYTDPETLK